MNSILSISLLVNTSLAWAIGEGLPFNACECWYRVEPEKMHDILDMHIRLCGKEDLHELGRGGNQARCWDESAHSDGSQKELVVRVNPLGTLNEFKANLCSALYCES